MKKWWGTKQVLLSQEELSKVMKEEVIKVKRKECSFDQQDHIKIPKLEVHLFFSFSIWVFFHKHSRITRLQGKGEGISSLPLPPASQTLGH